MRPTSTYIVSRLFFKRVCDVCYEEYKEVVTETGDTELALFLGFPAFPCFRFLSNVECKVSKIRNTHVESASWLEP